MSDLMHDGGTLKGSKLMNDKEILMTWMGYTEQEAEEKAAQMKKQKIEDLKLQIIAQNPYFGAAGVMLPEEKAEECCQSAPKEVKGIMVFYFDVGTMAPEKAIEHTEKWKKQINEKGLLDRLKAQYIESLFMPVRDQETSVEYIKL